ncbi:hypothetical protein NP493_53g06016 [Ridgeia piscesae]|uniref:LIM zinc-binding domain-containing protein n=1 Tax=Ridgeia piscesae TaxID=27915 RepID=A0AAD9PB69_RIDPI|nr:hypothetical protein NP493_53g06016 [Ridgeia piscesae]
MAKTYRLEPDFEQLRVSGDTAGSQPIYSNLPYSAPQGQTTNPPVYGQQNYSTTHQVALGGYASPPRGATYASQAYSPSSSSSSGRYSPIQTRATIEMEFPPPPPPLDQHYPNSSDYTQPSLRQPANTAVSPPWAYNPVTQSAPPETYGAEGARSKVVYMGATGGQRGYVESRSTDLPAPPHPLSPQNKSQQVAALKSTLLKPVPEAAAKASPSSDSQKEAEVNALTKLLMKNMEASADPDFFGVCSKCHKGIMGDTQGCTALDKIYHIECFTCQQCGIQLKGQAFYALEAKPFCEPCYLNTLEKCSVCHKPITDRILRATGKPFHPACFVCVVCSKSLDGIPFTVDAASQIYCIEDFHKKFAPRCCVCGQAIMPQPGNEETVRIVAMDKSFHVECYRCEDCGMTLSSEVEGRGCYPLDDHILCKSCNAQRIQRMTSNMTTEL